MIGERLVTRTKGRLRPGAGGGLVGMRVQAVVLAYESGLITPGGG